MVWYRTDTVNLLDRVLPWWCWNNLGEWHYFGCPLLLFVGGVLLERFHCLGICRLRCLVEYVDVLGSVVRRN